MLPSIQWETMTKHGLDSLQIATDLNLVNFLVESKDRSKQATVLSVFGREEELDHIMGRLPQY